MILVVDIGNTNIVFGIYSGDDLTGTFRVETDKNLSSNDYAEKLLTFINSKEIKVSDIDGSIISSVVPEIDAVINEACFKYLGKEPVLVSHELDTGIKICYENPRQVGTDRIVNSIAAFDKYKQAVIVIDFGTATTFDYVTSKGEYKGGVIAPGMKISADALFENASKLPRVKLEAPEKVICTDTVTNMQAGIVFGYAGLVDGIVNRIKIESGSGAYVVATGGLASVIFPHSDTIEVLDEYLTLYGLRIIFERNIN